MDYGEKIKWLKQYQYSLRKKYELEQERERLQTEATHVTPLLSGMPGGGPNADKLPAAVERIMQAESDLADQITVCMELMTRIGVLIDTVQNGRQHEVLRRRYILGQRWELIAVEMNISDRAARRLHGRAVMALECPVL